MSKKGLYLQLFSLHGLVRGHDLEMGRDADTGGQVKYVLELAQALGRQPGVAQVDLFTRWIQDRTVSEDYSRPIEALSDHVRIVRIRCGGGRYLRKELLWPHLDEYVDKTLKFIRSEGRIPDLVHGHYADAGFVAARLSSFLGTSLVFTGHSLGRPKKAKLLAEGLKAEEIHRTYAIDTRIEAEEEVIQKADLVVTSTNQEIVEQYGLYENSGLTEYRVVPPGLDLSRFFPFYEEELSARMEEDQMAARHAMSSELKRFLVHPEKPLILALCRPDYRKNIAGLVHAYGCDKELQAIANLAIFAGIRKDIADMGDNEREVLTEMLLLMDRYDLYGRLAIPKKHDFTHEVPALYRLCASRGGVFTNPALTEPFGLTLLEAAACGLPLVATHDGGPKDILANCDNGLLVDPRDPEALSGALKKILVDRELWGRYSRNGVKNVRKHYSWETHCQTFLEAISGMGPRKARTLFRATGELPVGERLLALDRLLVTSLDRALIAKDGGLEELLELLTRERDRLGFVLATGRTLSSALQALTEHGIPRPDVLISSVGTTIHYHGDRHEDRGWATHISADWRREKLKNLLDGLPFLKPQSNEHQNPFKISYFMEPDPEHLPRINRLLMANRCRYNLIYSDQMFLDCIPHRAGKGRALRYLSYKWSIPLERILACGAAGTDEGMLRGEPRGVVVANHSPELQNLQGRPHIYFAGEPGARGILEGLRHYRFLEQR